MIPNAPISPTRITADIDALAAITEPGRPWTRRAFTPMFLAGRKWLEKAMQEAGAVTQIDAAGNLIGTIPMDARQDALTTAAWIALGVEELAKALAGGEAHFAATVGEFEMTPNAANVVPARVRMLIDARAELRDDMERFVEELANGTAAISEKTGVTVSVPGIVSDTPHALR